VVDQTQQSKLSDRTIRKLQRSGINVLVGTFIGPFIQGFLLFAYAGTVAVPRAWFLLVINLVGMFGQIAFVAARNPELVNHRGLWKKKKDTKSWDKKIVTGWGVLSGYMTSIVIGLDIRFDGANLGLWSAVVGTALFVFSVAVLTSAMLVNTYFEATVRIQTDRNHKVITAGPYKFIRHPGYVGAGLWALSAPLIVGSVYGLIPAGMAVLLLLIRTILEDRTLRRELTGYSEYARQVHYRLIPGLW
jgi:protein-S-isoprenylcysteine O-methyltransferase Ste14